MSLLDDRRIRIRTSYKWIQIREAQYCFIPVPELLLDTIKWVTVPVHLVELLQFVLHAGDQLLGVE